MQIFVGKKTTNDNKYQKTTKRESRFRKPNLLKKYQSMVWTEKLSCQM